jgi:uncharacterized heparinase superfamily protein
VLRFARTIRYLRADQLRSLAFRRIHPTSSPRRARGTPHLRSGISLSAPIPRTTDVPPASGAIDWESTQLPMLERYTLHYFDCALDPSRSPGWLTATIADWIARNPPGSQPAWAPYVASLRAVNWIKLFIRSPHQAGDAALASLYLHGLVLEANLEHHILANHYLKNGTALFFLGSFFDGPDAERWRARGLEILAHEIDEQMLADGGHFERSPMYHAIAVEDLLDLLNLIAGGAPAPEPFRAALDAAARRALAFLDAIVMPDGEIPLFGDAAFGVAPAPHALFSYARTLIANERAAPSAGLDVRAFDASGYYVLRRGTDVMIVDCGELGPRYQPGHAHADMLSYELALGGRRVVVDTGVCGYEPSASRLAIRGTAAHNTVLVDGADQAEVWHAFRLASRAQPLDRALERNGTHARFTGAHDGYRTRGGIIHHRTIDFDGSSWRIQDDLEGTGTHRIESLVHLHPDLRAHRNGDSIDIVERGGAPVAHLRIEGAAVAIEPSVYCPRFGRQIPNLRLRFIREGALPCRMAYEIRVPAPAHP